MGISLMALPLILIGCRDDFPTEFTGKYYGYRDGEWRSLMVSPTGLTRHGGESITYGEESSNTTDVQVDDPNNVRVKAIFGEWSDWDGYAETTCKGGITRIEGKLIVTLAGPKYCSKFAGEWQEEDPYAEARAEQKRSKERRQVVQQQKLAAGDPEFPEKLRGSYTMTDGGSCKKHGTTLVITKRNMLTTSSDAQCNTSNPLTSFEDDEPAYIAVIGRYYTKVSFIVQGDIIRVSGWSEEFVGTFKKVTE